MMQVAFNDGAKFEDMSKVCLSFKIEALLH